MRKLFLFAVAAFAMLATSCSKDADVITPGEEVLVSFDINTPELATRAISDGTTATKLYYAVYDGAGKYLDDLSGEKTDFNIKTTLKFKLVDGMTYKFAFWAQNPNAPYTFTPAPEENVTAKVTVDYTNMLANQEIYDAFFAAIDGITINGGMQQSVDLYRPFAQLNIATADYEDAKKSNINVTETSVTLMTYTTLDLVSGNVSGDAVRTFDMYAIPNEVFKSQNVEYKWLSMNYILIGSQELVNVTFNTNDTRVAEKTWANVPVQRNYRTNIVGNILTSDVDVNIEIKPEYGGDNPDTLEEELKLAAQIGGSVTLTEDVVLSKPLEVVADMTINLNGKTITTSWDDETNKKHYYAIKNYGNLTIDGEGSIKSRGIYNYGKLTLESGTLDACDGNGGYAVDCYEGAEFIMNGGEVKASYEDDNLVDQGGYDATPINVRMGAKATINAGEIINDCDFTSAIMISSGGEVVINGGEIESIHSTIYNMGTITINAGSITCNGVDRYTQHCLVADNGSTTTINGGTFDGKDTYNGFAIDMASGSTVAVAGGTFLPVHSGTFYNPNNGTLTVTGGTYADDVTSYLAAGYIAVDNSDGTWTVAAKADNVTALAAALAAGGEVALNDSIEVSESLVIPEGVEVTLLLNGKTLTGEISRSGGAVLENNGTLKIVDGTVSSTATNGAAAIYNCGVMTLDGVAIAGAPSDTSTGGYASYAVSSTGAGSKLTVTNCNISGRGSIAATNGSKVTINSGTYNSPTPAWGHAVYASDEGTEIVINGGKFTEGWEYANDLWGMYQIYAGKKAKVIVNDGDFSQEWDCANGYDLATAEEGKIEIKGGVFADNPSSQNGENYVAAGYITIQQTDGTYKIEPIIKEGVSEIELGDAHPYATIVVDGDITIKGDTKVKTITSTTGGTITIEDGKTLTLNNFSFGSGSNPGQTYKIEGGTVKANYGFFQHGTYKLHSDFETNYMYYSFGSNITVYGTFHSQGAGDGVDYVRGNLTIAAGGKSIHDRTLWVGQPASWGAMTASLTIEPGGKVQANSLKVYAGSSLIYTNDTDLSYENTDINQGGTITKL